MSLRQHSGLSNRSTSIWFHIGAVVTVMAWGVSFVSTKVLLENGLSPAMVYVIRFLIAYCLMCGICHTRLFANSLRDELLFLACGLCGGSIYFIAENTALNYTLVTNVSLLTTTSPLLTTLLVGILYKSERPGKGFVAGSILALIGVGCVVFNSSLVVRMNPLGDMLALLAALGWAIYSIVLRKLNVLYSVAFITRKMFFYGVVTAIPFLMAEPSVDLFDIMARPQVWGNIAFLGIIASVIAYYVWALLVKRLGAVKSGNYLYFQPVVTMIASALFFDEVISVIGVTGCSLIVLGVWLGDYLSRKQKY